MDWGVLCLRTSSLIWWIEDIRMDLGLPLSCSFLLSCFVFRLRPFTVRFDQRFAAALLDRDLQPRFAIGRSRDLLIVLPLLISFSTRICLCIIVSMIPTVSSSSSVPVHNWLPPRLRPFFFVSRSFFHLDSFPSYLYLHIELISCTHGCTRHISASNSIPLFREL